MSYVSYLDLMNYLRPESRCAMRGEDYESLIWLSPEIPQPTQEECDQARDSFLAALPMLILRDMRDMKLRQCDYVVATDYVMPEEKRAEWITYRQALRDFPADVSPAPEISEHRVLTNVTWPTPPSK